MDGSDHVSNGLLCNRDNDNMELQRRHLLLTIEALQRLLSLRLLTGRDQLLQRDKVGSFYSRDCQAFIDVNIVCDAPLPVKHLRFIKSVSIGYGPHSRGLYCRCTEFSFLTGLKGYLFTFLL